MIEEELIKLARNIKKARQKDKWLRKERLVQLFQKLQQIKIKNIIKDSIGE